MSLVLPECRFADLPKETREVGLIAIRMLITNTEIRKLAETNGLEATEEHFIKLYDAGYVKILSNDENFWIAFYDSKTGIYQERLKPAEGVK